MKAPLSSTLVGLAVLTLVVSACGLTDLGSENTSPTTLRLEYENTSDEYLYLVQGFGDDREEQVLLTYDLLAIPPNTSYEVGAGGDPRTTDDGCFVDQQFWIVRSRDNVEYWRTWEKPPERTLDDLEVVSHMDPTTCLEPGRHSVQLP